MRPGLPPVTPTERFRSLRKAGSISLSASKLAILDWDALAEVGDFNERYLHQSA